MGLRSFLVRHSGAGKRLEAERRTMAEKLAAARAENATLRAELKQAVRRPCEPPARSPKLEADLAATLAEICAKEDAPPLLCDLTGRLNLAASESDIMMKASSPAHYLSAGLSALQAMHVGIPGLSENPPARILDFGCGYGRVARFMRAHWPAAILRVCDVGFDGLAFCLAHLGMQGFQVGTDPKSMNLEGGYDLIWVGSVVTHLDAPVIRDLLQALRDALAPGGHLCFTSHGEYAVERIGEASRPYGLRAEDAAKVVEGYRQSSFGYSDYPNQQGYGVSAATEAWLRQTVAEIPGLRWVNYQPQGWDHHQDVAICVREG